MSYNVDDSESGYDHKLDKTTKHIVGAGDHEVIDLTSTTDYEETSIKNCRYFEVDTEGLIKFSYFPNNKGTLKTIVMIARAGLNRYRNIHRVYKNYKSSEACTAKVYNDEGNEVTGIRLIR